MIRFASLSIAALGLALAAAPAGAQERHEEQHAAPARAPARQAPPRQAAPRFQAHPAGVHPRGPTAHAHAIRVLAPSIVVRGHGSWGRWDHPEFARPSSYWAWGSFQNVSCIAEDSYGDQYPVTEAAGPAFVFNDMTAAEDDALDRCYSESGQDPSCYLATCSHF